MSPKEAGQHRKAAILIKIVVGCVLAGIFLISFAPFILVSIAFGWRPYRHVQASVSPGGEYTVTVKSTDARGFFGPADTQVIAGSGNHQEVYQTEIFDDGGWGGVRIFWLGEDTARVVLYGSEQPDEAVTITFLEDAPVLEAVQLPVSEPPPEELQEGAVHSIWVNIHDGEHKFWVGLYENEDDPDITTVMVYDLYRQEIAQVFEDPAQPPDAISWPGYGDINGDGYTDFYYSLDDEHTVYLWDPETECFVQSSAEVQEVSNGETSDTLDLDVGDGAHRFYIEIAEREGTEEYGIPIQVSIYPEGGGQPVQTWADVFSSDSMEWMTLTAQDVNFDGCMDFTYPYRMGVAYGGTAYMVWDAETEQFVRDPYGLECLPMPRFDQEKQLIETWWHNGIVTETAYYRYYDGELTCVRRLMIRSNFTTWTAVLIVEDYDEAAGTLEEVYRAEDIPDNGVVYPSTEEFARWDNLDYHGEE